MDAHPSAHNYVRGKAPASAVTASVRARTQQIHTSRARNAGGSPLTVGACDSTPTCNALTHITSHHAGYLIPEVWHFVNRVRLRARITIASYPFSPGGAVLHRTRYLRIAHG